MASGSPGGTGRRKGRCKWFNVAKGWGFITPDDGSQDIFVHQSVIQMSGFRSLGDEEEVEFECKGSDKGLEATVVTGLEGIDCRGSHRRPQSKKRFRKIRCYNCGEFANHIAAKCSMGPQPKRCHNCKAVDHLIADCPSRDERKKKVKNGNGGNNNDTANNHTGTNGGASGGSQPPSQPPSESHPSPSPCPSPNPGSGNTGNGGPSSSSRRETPRDMIEGLTVITSSNNGNHSSPSPQELHLEPMEPASRGYVITSTTSTNSNSSLSCQPVSATVSAATEMTNSSVAKTSSANGDITNA